MVEQRRDQALRRLSAVWDAKILRKLQEAEPGRAGLERKRLGRRLRPLWRVPGQDDLRGGEQHSSPDSSSVLGYLPTDEEWNLPNIWEDNPVGKSGVKQ